MITYRLIQITYLFLVVIIFASTNLVAQTNNYIFSTQNRIAFGNNLFCERDYLRAIDEFKFVLKSEWNDSLQFKIATAYLRMSDYNQAYKEYQKICENSLLYEQSEYEKLRSLFKSGKYSLLNNQVDKQILNSKLNSLQILRLRNSALLLGNRKLPEKNDFISVYVEHDKTRMSEFYNWKSKPPFKSPTTAAIMSALIPGSGKIYADEIGDGITAFLLTGLFTYLAVDKFQNNQNSSAWLYTSIATFFYAGNVYGSATAVQNYNAGIKFNFDSKVKLFINDRNQFLPTPKHLCN